MWKRLWHLFGLPQKWEPTSSRPIPQPTPKTSSRGRSRARSVLARGGGKEDLKTVLMKSAKLIEQGAKGLVYGRNIYQHANPGAVVRALMTLIHTKATAEEAWGMYNCG